jgi:hypothetical protein
MGSTKWVSYLRNENLLVGFLRFAFIFVALFHCGTDNIAKVTELPDRVHVGWFCCARQLIFLHEFKVQGSDQSKR